MHSNRNMSDIYDLKFSLAVTEKVKGHKINFNNTSYLNQCCLTAISTYKQCKNITEIFLNALLY